MSAPSESLVSSLVPAFVAFLRNAVTAFQDARPEAHLLWLEAAAHLYATDDESIAELVTALVRQSALEEAIAVAEAAGKLHPDSAAVAFSHGYALQMAGRHGDAVPPYRHAMTCDANRPQLRNNLAAAIRLTGGDPSEEHVLLEQAVGAHPQDSNAWINLTMARRDAMDMAGALAAGQRAVELGPENALARNNYGLILKEAGLWDEAEVQVRTACEIAPDNASYRYNRSILHLVRGNYVQGWAGYESRWQGSGELRGNLPALPGLQWSGQPLTGKTLFVWGEQGMGDVLQFCRLMPRLAERVHREGGRLEWNSFPQMGALLKRSLGWCVDGLTLGGGIESLPGFDFHLPLLSVPFMLGLCEATIPVAPYLRPDPVLTTRWKTRLASEKRFKVGLAWTGSPHHKRNAFRRVGWERYVQFLKGIEGVAFYSLQPGEAVEAARLAGLVIEDHTQEFRTFDDTAAFTTMLDLVITVCTSVAHLSGALGRPTWLLLDVNPHWPWLLERLDSPWYPNTRLYRQRQFGQWDPVLQELAEDLVRFARR